jgi:hypothetical protein
MENSIANNRFFCGEILHPPFFFFFLKCDPYRDFFGGKNDPELQYFKVFLFSITIFLFYSFYFPLYPVAKFG